MPTITLPFAEWTPDHPEIGKGDTEAKNVIPAEGGYSPLPGLSAVTGATLTGRCQGARAFPRKDGSLALFAGDATKLYRRDVDAFTNLSGSQTFACPTDEYWAFEHFDDDVVACNIVDALQVVGVDGAGVNFAAVAGSPPPARHILHDRGPKHLLLGNTKESGVSHPRRIRWSGANDIEVWGEQRQYQSGYQDMPEAGGWVQGLVGQPYPTVFQDHMIRRLTYVGGDTVYAFDTIEAGLGAMCGGPGIVSWGARTFFWDESGPYMWDGSTATPLGDGKVARWFRANLSYPLRNLTVGAFDPKSKLIAWAFPASFSGTSYAGNAYLVVYSIKANKWSWGEVTTEYLVGVPDRGYTLEELDAFGTLETLLWSLDSRAWLGGQLTLGAFNTSHQLASFSGANLAGTIDTAEGQTGPGMRGFINAVRPLVDNTSGTITAQVATRAQKVGDTLTYGTASSQNVAGLCPLRAEGRYFRARVNIPAGAAWTHAQGVEATIRAAGRR